MSDDEPVPRVGRGPLFGRMQTATLFKIAGLGVILVAVVVLRRPCADSVSGFVNSFDPPPDAAPTPATRDMEVIRLTPEEIERRFPSVEARDAGAATAPDASVTQTTEPRPR